MHNYTYNEAEEVTVLEILSSSPYYLFVKSFPWLHLKWGISVPCKEFTNESEER